MIAYLLKVTLCWSLFYIVYHFLLSKETFFRINRWYLLSTLLIGLILPLFQFDLTSFFKQEPVAAIAYASESFHQMEVVITSSVQEAEKTTFSWLSLLLVIYWIGVAVAFFRFLHGFNQIVQLYRQGTIYKKKNYYLVLTKEAHLPFSFFNHIFWNESTSLEDVDSGKILSHETAHINQGHSLDVLFLEFLGILLWFSPPIYWYKKSLRAVHEFLADAYVLRDTKKKQYGHLLIKQAQSGMQVALANNFIHSQLKKRINMMTRNKSRRKALMRYLPALPILLIAVLLFASKNNTTDLEGTYLQSVIAFEQMLDGDFDPQKVKEALAEAYLNGSKLTKKENGESIDWDAHKIGALERRGNRLIETYPDNQADILLIMMEVAAENGYALRFKGTKIEGYREMDKPTDKIVEDNDNYLLTPNGDGKNDLFQIEDLEDYSNSTLDIYNKWGDMIFSSVNYINDWDGKDLNTGQLLPEATYYYQLKSMVNDKSKQGYIQLKRTEAPIFADGEKEMLHFIYKRILYPAEARENETYGTAVVDFTVTKEGTIINPEITKDVADGLGQEVLRIVKLMQDSPRKWTPGTKDGEAVDMKFTLPVQYRLEGQYENGDSFTLANENEIDAKVVVTGLFKGTKPNNPTITANIEKPVFPGGEREMLQFIYKAITYPAKARENGTYGTAVVEFIVKKDGSIIHPQITTDRADGIGQEALRVVRLLQDLPERWTPGKKDGEIVDMKYTLRFKYRLEGLNKEVVDQQSRLMHKSDMEIVVTGLYTQNDKTLEQKINDVKLIIVDGKEYDGKFEDINMDKIAEMNVYKDENAVGKYGERAKNGVLVIKLKKEEESPIPTQTASGEPIYKEVDEMPRFPGCEGGAGTAAELKGCADRKMLEFIYTNIKYPTEARDKGIQGTVVIRFLVEKDGSISGAKIVRNVGGGTGEEALRVINLMKEMPQKWISGRQDGKAVNVYYNIPIKFKLAEEEIAQEVVEPTQSKSPIPTQTAAGEPIYKEVDEMPRFPGCEEKEEAGVLKSCADRKMLEFIYTNIKYPAEARDKGIQGVVVIRFLVEKDGSISGAKIVRNVGGGTGEEALKVVNMMAEMPQKWIPGRKDGKAVNVIFNLPVKFKLAEEKTTEKKEKATDESKNRLETIAPKLERGAPEDAMELTLSGKKVILNAFPNPAREKLTITMEGQVKKVLLTVFDVTGKEVYRKDIKTFDGVFSETINLAEAAKGALIINVNHEGLNIQKKVIVH